MNFLQRLLCCYILLSLIGCATHEKALVKTQSVEQCHAICVKNLASCKVSCSDNCSICSVEASQRADKAYKKYVHEQTVEGGFITRGLKSYRDPLQCRKVSCNCYADVSICEQNCRGIIHKQLRAMSYCA